MATVVLQAAGAAIGGAVGGPIGAMIGRAAGGFAGSMLDQRLFGGSERTIEGPRLASGQILSSRAGMPIAETFGANRVTGEIIWATRFEEVQTTESQTEGGKGAPTQTTTTVQYSYLANFAVGLCEGPIGGIGRIWADGRLLQQTRHTIRLKKGGENQNTDDLIRSKQTSARTPAYRGLAYLVFERFEVGEFGNRIPQISVEVFRPVGSLEKHVYGVNLIPGASEFAYDPDRVDEAVGDGTVKRLNCHQSMARTDIVASLDELEAQCPNLEQVAIVAAWFGDDLRASHCKFEPRVETNARTLVAGEDWRVAGIPRSSARLVSTLNGRPVYGGTPSDNSVVRAIQEIKKRGLKICMHPFVLMDVPTNNSLPDPYGGNNQAGLPWRGRITCHPAAGRPNSVDATNEGGQQIDAILGNATPSQISIINGEVVHSGISDWGYRRFILHYARLCQLAGGVDMFLLGSEMRGLTRVRDGSDTFRFVEDLRWLAGRVKSILGASVRVGYGADWSEYSNYAPEDGSGDLFYNMDRLWSSPNVDFVGIDNYMPLSDFRPFLQTSDAARASQDRKMMAGNIAAGEGYDWYYQSAEDRDAGIRTPITDGQGKPWVYRYKDMESWWTNPHRNRANGIEAGNETEWQPQSKPIVFTEYGCPAIDNGAAQPNVFYDPKSSESEIPYFSTAGRDDGVQASYLQVQQAHWDPFHPDFNSHNNRQSIQYAGRMVDFGASQIWAWDARPYPEFPLRTGLWSDGPNWQTGHWLNGRLGRLRLSDLIGELLTKAGITEFDVSQVYEVADGYVIGETTTLRARLEAILDLYRISVFEDRGTLVFRSPGRDPVIELADDQLARTDNGALIERFRAQSQDLPHASALHHMDPSNRYQDAESRVERANATELQLESLHLPLGISPNVADNVVGSRLRTVWTSRDRITFSLPLNRIELTIGDTVRLPDHDPAQNWIVRRIEESDRLVVEAHAIDFADPQRGASRLEVDAEIEVPDLAAPDVVFLDLPHLKGGGQAVTNLVAARTVPWPGRLQVYSSPNESGFRHRQDITIPAATGRLLTSLAASNVHSRLDWSQSIDINLQGAHLADVELAQLLSGSNSLAVASASGGWEVIQFLNAELVGVQAWRLTGLLRGQGGTEDEAESGAAIGSRIVLLNEALHPIADAASDLGRELNWLIGPPGYALNDPEYSSASFAPGYRGERPFRPVHVRYENVAQGVHRFSWVRRNRFGADDWSLVEVPMSEDRERYLVVLRSPSGGILERETEIPHLEVMDQELSDGLGSLPSSISIEVAQISAVIGPGSRATASFELAA